MVKFAAPQASDRHKMDHTLYGPQELPDISVDIIIAWSDTSFTSMDNPKIKKGITQVSKNNNYGEKASGASEQYTTNHK